MSLVLARTVSDLAAARKTLDAPTVLVPTMGALHDGHRALIQRAGELARPNGSVVVSVFVNPLQFGAGEDFDEYPRPLEADLRLCGQADTDVVFAPSESEMYPQRQHILVSPGPVGEILEGTSRPGFFTGVLTVILKLFELVRPQIAVFGEKDAQQLALVRQMTEELNLGIQIANVPTVRDHDGLAVSSRNIYLSAAERLTARKLSAALQAGYGLRAQGPAAVLAAAAAILDEAAHQKPPLVLEYLVLVEAATFRSVKPDFSGDSLLLIAASIGRTRLIDNLPMRVG